MSRINRELGGDFDVRLFKHIAFWNPGASRIEMHLESRVAQTVNVRDLNRSFHFARGERIHTENSYKFTPASIARLLHESGFRLEKSWTDPKEWFCVLLARALIASWAYWLKLKFPGSTQSRYPACEEFAPCASFSCS